MKAVIIGSSGHIDLALGVRDRIPQVVFAGIAPGSRDEDTRSFFIEQMEPSLLPFYEDYRLMLDREKPDIAVVAPFFSLQSRIAIDCLERGIATFLEKPMAASLGELSALRKTHARTGAKLCPMLPYRYHPEFWAAYRTVKEGLIGEPLLLTAQKSYKLGERHPMYRRRASYGGTIPWVAIHAIDWIHWFTGGKIAEVAARQTTAGNAGHGEMESAAVLLYGLTGSGLASVSCDFFRPKAAPSHGDDRIRIAGEKGIVEVRGGQAELVTHGDGPRVLSHEPEIPIFRDFVRHIETGSPMRISAEDAFAISEIALRSREAADSNTLVRIG